MDGWICFWGGLGGGEVGFDWRGVGWDEFFCFLFFLFSAGLRWILWAVNDVVEVVGR